MGGLARRHAPSLPKRRMKEKMDGFPFAGEKNSGSMKKAKGHKKLCLIGDAAEQRERKGDVTVRQHIAFQHPLAASSAPKKKKRLQGGGRERFGGFEKRRAVRTCRAASTSRKAHKPAVRLFSFRNESNWGEETMQRIGREKVRGWGE